MTVTAMTLATPSATPALPAALRPWHSRSRRLQFLCDRWLEAMVFGDQSPGGRAQREVAHAQLKELTGDLKVSGRALVSSFPGFIELPMAVSTLMSWKESRLLGALLAASCPDEFAADGARGPWEAIVVPLPAGFAGQMPPGWVRLHDSDTSAVIETARVLIVDGMPPSKAIASARALER